MNKLVVLPLLLCCFFGQSQDLRVDEEAIPYTGTLDVLWQSRPGNEFGYAPKIEGGVLFIVNAIERNDTGRGQIMAFNKNTGDLIWESKKHYGEPLKDLVIEGNEIIYTTRRGVYAVDKSTGEDLWSFSNPFYMQIGSSPAVFGDIVVAATSDKYLFGFSKSKLELVWKRKLTEIATPTLYSFEDNVIFSDFEDGVYSIDAATGKTNWYLKRPVASKLHIEGQKGYLGNGDRGLLCLDLARGKELWETEVGDGNPIINGVQYGCASDYSSRPLDLDGKLLAGDYTSTVTMFEKSGEVVWTNYFPELSRSDLIRHEDGIMLVSENSVTLIDEEGKVEERLKIPHGLSTRDFANEATVEGNFIYMTNERGQLMKFRI